MTDTVCEDLNELKKIYGAIEPTIQSNRSSRSVTNTKIKIHGNKFYYKIWSVVILFRSQNLEPDERSMLGMTNAICRVPPRLGVRDPIHKGRHEYGWYGVKRSILV